MRFRRRPSWPSCGWGRSKTAENHRRSTEEEGSAVSLPASPAGISGGGSGTRGGRSLALGALVSLVALGLVLYFTDLDALAQALRQADYRLVAAAVGTSLLWLFFRAAAWHSLLGGQATYSQAFFTINEGYLFNNFLPLKLGEAARAFLLSRKAGLSFWRVFSSILIERVLDLAFAAGLLLAVLPLVVQAVSSGPVLWARPVALSAAALVLLGLAALFLLARNRYWAQTRFERLARRWPWLERLGGRVVQNFLQGLAVLTDPKLFLRAVGWMALDWMVAILQYFILLSAFFPGARLLWAAFSLGIVALGAAAPSVPGAVGVLEGLIMGALAVFGLDASTAFAFALTVHLLQYLVTGVIGIYALGRDGETLAGLYRKLRSRPETT